MTHFTGDFTQLRVLLALVKALHDNEKKILDKNVFYQNLPRRRFDKNEGMDRRYRI